MSVTIEPLEEYLRVIVRHRTSDDLQSVVATIFAAAEKHRLSRVLIRVEESDAIFAVRKLNLQHYLDRVIQAGGAKVALVSDSSEVFASHQYIALLGKQHGVRMKAFRAEDAARSWLLQRKGKACAGATG